MSRSGRTWAWFLAAVFVLGGLLLVATGKCGHRPAEDSTAELPATVEQAAAPSPCPTPPDLLDAVRRAYFCGAARTRCDIVKKGCGPTLVEDCKGVDLGHGPQ